jgi:hypothetical protein
VICSSGTTARCEWADARANTVGIPFLVPVEQAGRDTACLCNCNRDVCSSHDLWRSCELQLRYFADVSTLHRPLILTITMSAVSLLVTDLSKTNVGSWTMEQLQWLDKHYTGYDIAHKHGSLSTFWPLLFSKFLNLWPIRKTLWPDLPDTHKLTAAELCVIFEGEKYCKFVSTLINERVHR